MDERECVICKFYNQDCRALHAVHLLETETLNAVETTKKQQEHFAKLDLKSFHVLTNMLTLLCVGCHYALSDLQIVANASIFNDSCCKSNRRKFEWESRSYSRKKDKQSTK
jgi:hypothetical protein